MTSTSEETTTRRAPVAYTVDEDAVAAAIASAVRQGFPPMVSDPAVLRAVEEAVR
jgi:hypothetical protein